MTIKNKSYIPLLTIAGSDSAGGAGIQADLKTFSALGCYGMSVITATTAQNTCGVSSIHDIPVDHIMDQLKAVMEDIPPLAIKIGMLNRPEVVIALANYLRDFPQVPLVFDPVMVATSGARLIQEETVSVLKERLFPLSTLITPNLDEAAVLLGRDIQSRDEMILASKDLLGFGSSYVLVKGGHLVGESVFDVLGGKDSEIVFEHAKIQTSNVHGTGCTLSSAIAAYLGQGLVMDKAVAAAREYILGALEAGKDVQIGQGNGPLNHFHHPNKLIKI
ncbi:hydroxymethylpyrimidine/phosphomethylpyrimidine kinase [Echinicola pacifica]|uniref:hydroxymethylpyrimidine kinase n=1 Tax=Echinicola pacifica TaxID=346377 RepID=A0A918UVC5_9BACT|nr:bifunctional hydroxymethylpyrimidine kinase/phosphomethylpyrimidine kinase [Echinicola pacifica]GGZ36810.1 hydroxymethylpyrimidine/phosphomethylpyrimidine kinase [Echinicola pacifica]